MRGWVKAVVPRDYLVNLTPTSEGGGPNPGLQQENWAGQKQVSEVMWWLQRVPARAPLGLEEWAEVKPGSRVKVHVPAQVEERWPNARETVCPLSKAREEGETSRGGKRGKAVLIYWRGVCLVS